MGQEIRQRSARTWFRNYCRSFEQYIVENKEELESDFNVIKRAVLKQQSISFNFL